MIRSKFNIGDNSGDKNLARAISPHNFKIGQTFKVSVLNKKDLKKIQCILYQTKKIIKRKDGTTLKFDKNTIALLKNKQPFSQKSIGACPFEILAVNSKLISLAQIIL